MSVLRKKIVVASDGSGDFLTLSEAVKSCAAQPQQAVLFYIKAGIYPERPFIELDDYIIEGEDKAHTIITAHVGGRDPWPGEAKTGTFRSQTLFLGGQSAVVMHLTVQNTAGDGADVGQAIAVYADAKKVLMQDVILDGNQDTLFTAPLPLHEREPNGFRGPRENAPRLDTVQYYRDCIISGNIDFIFGGADAVFDHCRIVPKRHKSEICYITAPSTPCGQRGYLFYNCTVQGDCVASTVYLGRPWREFATCYWLDCTFSDEVCSGAWDNWRNTENEKTVRFGEFNSAGAGRADVRSFGTVDDVCEKEQALKHLLDSRSFFEIER